MVSSAKNIYHQILYSRNRIENLYGRGFSILFSLGVSLTPLCLLVLTIWRAATPHNRLQNVSISLDHVCDSLKNLSKSITRFDNGVSDLVTRVKNDIVKIYAILDNRYVTTGRSPVALSVFRGIYTNKER